MSFRAYLNSVNDMVRTRIAPSPTGFPHIGTIYQVLFDFAYAKKHNGKFVLRIEDTDRVRFVEGAEDVIYASLAWFELYPDESPLHDGGYGPYRQSERLDIYKKYVEELISKGHAYYCFCTRERLDEMRQEQISKKIPPMYDRLCRQLSKEEVDQNLKSNTPKVVRMKIPDNRKITFQDLIIGRVEFDSASIDDQVIYKSDGFPTYHLGVVVDDHLMEISHVFRGKEWISSTPKHVLLYEFFGWEMPVHAHLPLILNSDGKGKLSKRHGHASVDYYKTGGYLPEAVLNYLSNIVWNHPDGKEVYSLDEFMKLFDITELTSQGARFDLQKLNWMNQQYIIKMPDEELKKRLLDFFPELFKGLPSGDGQMLLDNLLPFVRERMQTLKDFEVLAGHFFAEPKITNDNEKERVIADDLVKRFSEIKEWNKDNIFSTMKDILVHHAIKMPVLYRLLTGVERGLPLPESLEILGKEKTLVRLHNLLQ